jgi:hypothetical protein
LEAIERVAKHCPVHETIETMESVAIEILGQGQCVLESQ